MLLLVRFINSFSFSINQKLKTNKKYGFVVLYYFLLGIQKPIFPIKYKSEHILFSWILSNMTLAQTNAWLLANDQKVINNKHINFNWMFHIGIYTAHPPIYPSSHHNLSLWPCQRNSKPCILLAHTNRKSY